MCIYIIVITNSLCAILHFKFWYIAPSGTVAMYMLLGITAICLFLIICIITMKQQMIIATENS